MALTNNQEIQQRNTCSKYRANYCPSPQESIIGISSQMKNGEQPIHGLRHPLIAGTTGWYIWAGDYSDDPNFFKPIHTKHLYDLYPDVLKFLGLPPGWRFLLTEDYEDVWYDGELLKI